jgi:2'-hydroxyisoflavone reductase
MTPQDRRDRHQPARVTQAPLTLLVLGGTSWLGGAVARAALERGHQVTCLARGVSGTPPEGARFVRADRWQPGAYREVTDTEWDGVVDVSWQPELVRGALDALSERAAHWLYVSSASVYADNSEPRADESAALVPAWDGAGQVGIEQYGEAKVACERACLASLPGDRVLVARAGLIAGYGDLSDRFGYWPGRVAGTERGKQDATSAVATVLTPPGHLAVQVIDVLDLATWLVDAVEQRIAGIFNAMGDSAPFNDLWDACAEAAGARPRAIAAPDDAWLLERDVSPWAGEDSLPLWLPAQEYRGFSDRSNEAAKSAGLTLRPLTATVRDALEWERELGLNRARHAGLSPARERALIEAL